MTEFHAGNLLSGLLKRDEAFRRAVGASDWPAAETEWRGLLTAVNTAVSCARSAQIEADALAAELLVYRPTRHDRPPAPPLEGYVYVFTAKTPWVCAAVELKQAVYVQSELGCNYFQEHCVPEQKTLCRKPVTYPVSERFTSGGWPRLHELCPDCTKLLVKAGLLTAPG